MCPFFMGFSIKTYSAIGLHREWTHVYKNLYKIRGWGYHNDLRWAGCLYCWTSLAHHQVALQAPADFCQIFPQIHVFC